MGLLTYIDTWGPMVATSACSEDESLREVAIKLLSTVIQYDMKCIKEFFVSKTSQKPIGNLYRILTKLRKG